MSHPKRKRDQRSLSETFKRDAVLSYETGRQSVSQICHSLKVSQTSVYRWIDHYSTLKTQGIHIVEKKDSQASEIAKLKADLERARQTIANQSIKLDYYEILHPVIHEQHDIDVKKIDIDSPCSSACVSGCEY